VAHTQSSSSRSAAATSRLAGREEPLPSRFFPSRCLRMLAAIESYERAPSVAAALHVDLTVEV
jgi:hypothetical protein